MPLPTDYLTALYLGFLVCQMGIVDLKKELNDMKELDSASFLMRVLSGR